MLSLPFSQKCGKRRAPAICFVASPGHSHGHIASFYGCRGQLEGEWNWKTVWKVHSVSCAAKTGYACVKAACHIKDAITALELCYPLTLIFDSSVSCYTIFVQDKQLLPVLVHHSLLNKHKQINLFECYSDRGHYGFHFWFQVLKICSFLSFFTCCGMQCS